jgi:Tfp pilus assembly protein PilN
MRVQLNLATKPLETHRRFLAGAGLSIFLASAAFLVLGWQVYSARKAAASVRAREQKIQKESAVYEVQRKSLERYFKQKQIAELDDRAAFINGIIVLRSFNWTQMFMDLERILPPGVRVIRVEPKQVSGHVEVSLTVGATSDEVKLQFLHALEKSGQFSEVQEKIETTSIGANNPAGDQKVVQLTAYYSGT